MLVPKLRFKEFTDEWQILKLSDIAFLTSSKRIYLSDYKNFGIPFYRGKEISELKKGKKISDLLYIDEVKYEEIKNKYGIPMKNDILITAVGTLANIYRIPNNEKFYFKDGNLIWLKDIKCNSSFLEYQLEYNRKKLLDSCIGSTQKALTIVGLNKINFNIPNEKEQEKISLIIALINKKILLQEQKIEALKLYKSHMINTFFGSRKGKIIFLGDIGTFLRGFSYNKNDVSKTGLLILRSNNISDNKINYDNLQFVTKKCNNELILKNNDIVICMANGSKNLVGKSAPYLKGKDNIIATVGAFCSIFRSDKKYSKYLFQTARYTKNIENMFEGTNINNLKNSNLEKLDFYIDDSNSSYYCELLEKLDSKYNLEILKYKKILDLKKGLMQDMFV